jgi:hypothetical protein
MRIMITPRTTSTDSTRGRRGVALAAEEFAVRGAARVPVGWGVMRREISQRLYAAIVALESAARNEAALVDREHECVKELAIVAVERNVDEDRLGRRSHGPGRYRFLNAPAAFFEVDFLRPCGLAAFFALAFLALTFFIRADAFFAPPFRPAGPKWPRYRSSTAGDASADADSPFVVLAVRAASLAEPSETEPTRRYL